MPNAAHWANVMMPFDEYPGGGKELLGRVPGGNCRHGYCLKFIQKTRQTACAYCGLPLLKSYQNWLQMALDHVVPRGVCGKLSLPQDWVEDYGNRVLTCAACNGFDNRYKPPPTTTCPQSLEDFFGLRDRIFADRKARIAACHKKETEFFEGRPWQ